MFWPPFNQFLDNSWFYKNNNFLCFMFLIMFLFPAYVKNNHLNIDFTPPMFTSLNNKENKWKFSKFINDLKIREQKC